MTQPPTPLHLPLEQVLERHGARFGAANGWLVPLDFGSAEAEYTALRWDAAAFDRSSRSRVLVTGTDAQVVLAAVFGENISDLEEGRAIRAAALDENGIIRDLALVARTGGIAYTVIAEPGQRQETLKRLQSAAGSDFDVQVEDRTERTCLLGIAGPRAEAVVQEHIAESLAGRLGALHCAAFQFHGFRGLAIRTSDTGEDGFDLLLATAVAEHLIDLLATAGVRLCGQTALESARVEACIPAFSPDLEPGLTPAEADLDVLLGIPGGSASRTLAPLLFDTPELPPQGTELQLDGSPVGTVRSAVRSFGLNAMAGLGIIDTAAATPGRELLASNVRATVVTKPLYRRRTQG